MSQNKSNAMMVKEFTEGTNDMACPIIPKKLSKENAFFLIRMVMSELDELACTVVDEESDCNKFMQEALNSIDKCKKYHYENETELIGAQADAMVDVWYYMLNIAAKHGINLSKLFDVIHEANMNKRDPKTGKFIKRESDGKVIKPVGWKEPDITGEIKRQFEDGSWNK